MRHKFSAYVREDYDADELEVIQSVERYRRTGLLPGETGPARKPKPFPTVSETLAVILALGYQKVGRTEQQT